MKKEAARAGVLDTPFGKFAHLQILTIEDLFAGKRPAMPPNQALKLGDFGTIKGGKKGIPFDRLGNVSTLGITFKERKGAVADVETLESAGVTTAQMTGSAKKSTAEVEIAVGFSKKHTMIYHGSGMHVAEVEDQLALGKSLAALLKKKNWKKNWVVVTALHVTQGATILLAQESSSDIRLTGKAEFSTGNLANASADVAVYQSSKGIVSYVQKNATPLLKARVVQKTGFKTFAADPDNALIIPLAADALALDARDEEDAPLEFVGVTFDYCDVVLDEGSD